jgi:tetratricopeptide (TPR) repeat protein
MKLTPQIITCALLGTLFFAASSTAFAQVEDTVEDPWQEARSLYRDRAYQEAIPYIVEAAQRDPDELRYIVSLARAHYQAGNYDRAVYYYDMYIGSESVDEYTGRYAVSTARSERNSANQNRETPSEPPRAPAYETQLLNSLNAQLESGPMLTETGGGAMASWNSLLQSGYVDPSLSTLRERIANGLVREARTRLRESAGWIPQLSLRQWETQAERYRLAKSLMPPPIPFDQEDRSTEDASETPASIDLDTTLSSETALEGWIAFCEGQIQYLNENYPSARERFDVAIDGISQHPEPLMGAINSIVAGQLSTGNEAPDYLRQLREMEFSGDKAQLILLYEALLANARGDTEEGAAALRSFFLDGRSPDDSESTPEAAPNSDSGS